MINTLKIPLKLEDSFIVNGTSLFLQILMDKRYNNPIIKINEIEFITLFQKNIK